MTPVPKRTAELSSVRIAVIGLACRLPGAANATEFWRLLESGKSAITHLDSDILLGAGLKAEEISDPSYVPVMAPLFGADSFDAGFFGMSDQEALLTDPQHRLFLQTAWHALENASVVPYGNDNRIGCYAGAGMSLYAGRRMASYASVNLLADSAFVDRIVAPQITVGNKHDYLATKTAYKFGLKGPAISLHTACSTGLVAVHVACGALRLEECDIAMAGAVALPTPLICGYRFDGGLLSPDGRCLPFDARANGTVGGGGAAVVILKRLDRAIADGDHIRAVILSSAINNDGADKVSFLSPSVNGQIDVIRSALERAGVASSTIGHVECHGTGTPHGDPIEFHSLTEAYGAKSTRSRWRCALGAAKANIGHLDTAAGAAGLIKAILALERGIVPPIAGFEHPNSELELDGNALYLPRTAEEWPVIGDHPRRAAVSSFGAGGTNAHLILEEFVQVNADPRAGTDRGGPAALLLSAKSPAALHRLTLLASETLVAAAGPWLEIAAASQRRHHFEERLAIIATNAPEAAAACRAFVSSAPPAGVCSSPPIASLPIVFLFAGQGGLDVAVIRSFRENFVGFARTFDLLSDQLVALGGIDLRELMTSNSPVLTAAVAQPLQFAFMLSLAELWMAGGVRPALVMGHSLGELAAAVVAGVLDAEAGMRLAAARGRLMDQHCAPGRMVAVSASRHRCECLLAEHDLSDDLDISVINSSNAVVISGAAAACDRLIDIARKHSIPCHRLETTHGFHSSAMDAMLPAFGAAVARERFAKARVPFIATSTRAGSYEDPAYWVDQVRRPVDFESAATMLLAERPWLSIELGCAATLTTLIEIGAAGSGHFRSVASALHNDQRGAAAFLHGAAALHCEGIAITWRALGQSVGATTDALPLYPFEQMTYCHTPNGIASAADGNSGRICQLVSAAKRLPEFLELVKRDVVLVASSTETFSNVPPGTNVVKIEDLLGGYKTSAIERLAQLAHSLERPLVVVDVMLASRSRAISDWINYTAVQAVLAAVQKGTFSADICIVTCGGAAIDELDSINLCPEQAAIWALARTARCELPDAVIHSLDIELFDTERLTRAMQASMREEQEVLVRQGHSFTLGWRREAIAPITCAFRGNAVYVIVGGMSGFGLAAAEHLANRGAGALILVGRGHTNDRKLSKRMSAIEKGGVPVASLVLDIADPGATAILEHHIETLGMPIGGIIHAAGVLSDRLILNQTEALLQEAMHPKLGGLSNLIELAASRPTPIDFLVAFSSIAGVFGSPGQASYAAANAAMTAAAQSGRNRGIPTVVVHWGSIEATGMTTRVQHLSGRPKFSPLPRTIALSALEGVLADPWRAPVVIAGSGPWPAFGMRNDGVSIARSIWTTQINLKSAAEAPTRHHRNLETLRDIVQKEVSRITGQPSDQIALNVPFAELGVDSLGGMQLRHALGECLGFRLDPALIYRHPTIDLLSRHIDVEFCELEPVASRPDEPTDVLVAADALAHELEFSVTDARRQKPFIPKGVD
jgi:acyl transferase domain-containing protein